MNGAGNSDARGGDMRKRPRCVAHKIVGHMAFGAAVVVAFAVAGVGSRGVLAASDTTKAQLTIQSSECVVDVVQDGSGQNLQIPSGECDAVAPSLLLPVLDQNPVPQLPFAGVDATVPIVVRQTPVGEVQETPTPVASISDQPSAAQSAAAATVMVAGIGTVVAATAVGVDAALFELSHSKSAARWAKERVKRTVPRRDRFVNRP